jgi:broad specificity phosphatase PhoE
MELILIRHGETDLNKQMVFRGTLDVRLNALGIAQADATAEALKDRVFEAIYTSPLKRAAVTATRIAKPHDIKVRVNDAFMDISFGAWQGKTEDEIASKFPGPYRRWKERPGGVKFPSGDGVKKTWKRVVGGLREIAFLHGVGTVVIVSHRVPVKMMTAYMLGKKRGDIHDVVHDPCAISIFEADRRTFKPVVLNDSSHLRDLRSESAKDF